MTSAQAPTRTLAPDTSSNIFIYDLLATGMVPEFVVRAGIRNMLAQKLQEHRCDPELSAARRAAFIEELKQSPIAVATAAANQQHYEVPAEFFQFVLGPHLKYSSCLWLDGDDLGAAERRMLQLTCERAGIAEGQQILDLGCGWGSFSLYAAANYKNVQVTAVSNSHSQRAFIERQAAARGLNNLRVITADINDFQIDSKFDRVVSVEMFEHAKNYQALFAKVAGWLKDDGRLFVHIFSHIKYQYHFDNSDPNDWLTKYFFTGGTMPSDDLFLYFADHLHINQHWRVSGTHYQKTAEAWLQNMLKQEKPIRQIMAQTYGADQTQRWWVYWRLFFLACSELWGYKQGTEWIVSHYLFSKN